MSAASSVRIMLLAALTAAAVHAASALAGSHVYTATDPVWKEECSACHIAYPPELLPAASWRNVMRGLEQHFGVNASLDAQTARHIAAFLESTAGGGETQSGSAVMRISQTRWFRREHDELPAGVWRRTDVRGPANCAACHTRAEAGDYGSRSRRVPH